MSERIEFSELEQILMDWSDEDAMRYAFGEFVLEYLTMDGGSHRYPDFYPQSIKDYQTADAVKRQEALDYCLGVARSARFSEERDNELKHYCVSLKKSAPTDSRDFLLDCIRRERSLQAGYLGLVQYLLRLEKVA